MTFRKERRQHRSDNKIEALGLWLAGLARRTGARGVSIGTSDGLTIAGWGADTRHGLLSAAGSMYAAGKTDAATREIPELEAWSLEAERMGLVFTSVGATIDAPDVVPHVQRILAG